MQPYSLCITSCQRHDLLQSTIESFLETCEQPPREILICEDGPEQEMPAFLRRFAHLGLRWICNTKRMGQIYSADRLMQESNQTHQYIFWAEDDWAFSGSNWLQKSFDILEKYPEIIQVSLRGSECNGHPLVKADPLPFLIQQSDWNGFGSFSFNPGLRRRNDYNRIGSYQQHGGLGVGGFGPERELSKLYNKLGYRIAVLDEVFARHTGDGRSKASQAIQYEIPKLLIAIKAGDRLDYGKWESEQSPRYSEQTNYHNKPYGTDIHISTGERNPRIQAVRETWAQDAKPYKNIDVKFCFGQVKDRQPLPDEVFLPVPDDYAHLAQKTREICRYALDNNFDYAFLCDDDTAIYVSKLLNCLMSNHIDYAGFLHGNVCSGGTGYFLSARAMREVVRNQFSHWAEDVSIGMTMDSANIKPVMLEGFCSGLSDHHFFPKGFDPARMAGRNVITMHAVFPAEMRAWWAYKNSFSAKT